MKMIEVLIRYWAVRNYDGANDSFAIHPVEPSYFNRIEILNNALTLYHSNNDGDNGAIQQFFNTANLRECGSEQKPFIYGHRDNPWHSIWHQNEKSFDPSHHHLFKIDFSEITNNDLHCILHQIQQYQSKNKMCDDEQACVLAQQDINDLLSRYSEHQQKLIDQASQSIYEKVQEAQIKSVKVFLNAFLNTFIQRYFKPLLITQGLGKNIIEVICGLLQTSVNYLTGQSLRQAMLATLASIASEPLLEKTGINKTVVSYLSIYMNSIINNLTDPFSALEWIGNILAPGMGMVFATGAGERFSEIFIRKLPKLKDEPPEDYTNIETASEQQDLPPGLRQRK